MIKQNNININLNRKNFVSSIVLIKKIREIISYFKKNNLSEKVFIVTDSNVANIYLSDTVKLFKNSGFVVFSYVFKAGEEQKSFKTLIDIYEHALKCGVDRQYNVIALGGGVVGDISGLFASTYMRGINLIQVPTTLLAMVDSSIGGKTAVNTKNGKNIVGTFYQPQFIFINPEFLKTLDMKQLKNGMAEVIKYSVSFDEKFFNQLSYKVNNSVLTNNDFNQIIYKCCKFKANIVQEDELEKKGIRQFLNFGHTFAHALETITKYKKFLHGEAVAVGMLFAVKLATKINMCNKEVEFKVKDLLESFCFDLKPKISCDKDNLLNLMKKDKKSVSNKIKFVLPTKIGNVISNVEVPDKLVLQTIEEILK